MQKNTTIIAAVVVAALIIAGVLYTQSQKGISPSTPTTTPETVTTPTGFEGTSSADVTAQETVVTITSSGFSPKDVTFKAGGTVTWMNEDSTVHNVSSAVHPTHQVYPPLNLGNIQPGGKVSLTFPTAGIYKYHDHLNPSLTGSVTVE